MLESRSIEESPMEDVLFTSSEKTKRDATQIFENLLSCDLEDEEDSDFIPAFLELASIDGIDGLITLSSENLRTL